MFNNKDYRRRLEFALANQLWSSCSHQCVYDYDSSNTTNPLAFRWTGSCYRPDKEYCIHKEADAMEKLHTYAATFCKTAKPCLSIIEWTERVAEENCPGENGGAVDIGWESAKICPTILRMDDGFKRADILYAASFNRSLAHHVFQSCSFKCVFDIENTGVAYRWQNGNCWEFLKDEQCIIAENGYEWAFDLINQTVCHIDIQSDNSKKPPALKPTPVLTTVPTASPTEEEPTKSTCITRKCIPQQEWSEDLMEAYCSPNDTGITYKHHCHIGRPAEPCWEFAELAQDLHKSLAMRLYSDCSSTCVFDYYSDAENAWKWSSADLCWDLEAWGSCQWDYLLKKNQPEWDAAKARMSLMCARPAGSAPTKNAVTSISSGCIPSYPSSFWNTDRAEELCPSSKYFKTAIFYGVQACWDTKSAMHQASLYKSLANKFFHRCTSMCIYDHDTIIKNIVHDYANLGGFQWNGKCWKWVTKGDCFVSPYRHEYEKIYLYAQNKCETRILL